MIRKSLHGNLKSVLAICLLATLTTVAFGIRAPTKPLAERVAEAKLIFVGKLANRVEDGDWVRADLIVQESLRKADPEKPVQVTWRKTVGGQHIYDAKEGARGIAILGDKHEDRFWLRSDKFEDIKKLDEVKAILKKAAK